MTVKGLTRGASYTQLELRENHNLTDTHPTEQMPSTVVHVALAGLLAAAFLSDDFDVRAFLIIAAVTIFPDLDVFVGWWLPGTHRAAFHTLLLPLVLGVLLYVDTHVRARSTIKSRWDDYGVRLAWVSVACLAVAAIGLDLFYNGVNLFFPIHDQFYDLSGRLFYSNQRGLVQTMVEWGEPATQAQTQTRTTANTHYSTGVDPSRGTEPENVERIFPIAWSGVQFLLVIVGYGTVAVRLWETRKR